MELTMLRRQFFNLYPSSYNLHHKLLLAKYNRFRVSSDCFQDSKVPVLLVEAAGDVGFKDLHVCPL